jgi:hypothetical protein
MSKNLKHLMNIHEAAQALHKLFVDSPWYIRTQVLSVPPDRQVVTDKREQQEIVVYVRTRAAGGQLTSYNSWPVRYEIGA